MKTITPLMVLVLILSFSGSSPAQTYDQPAIEAESGTLVSISPVDISDARYIWMMPDDFTEYQVDDASGVLYMAMPKRSIVISLLVAPNDTDKRLEIRRYKVNLRGTPQPDPDPSPEPQPTPEPDVSGYDGPNTHGIGEVAYNATKGVSKDRRLLASELLKTAIGHLQGVGGVKFISSPNSDENIFDWLAVNGQDWMAPLIKAMRDKPIQGVSLSDWILIFEEARAGIMWGVK